jgi:hypothetical protein
MSAAADHEVLRLLRDKAASNRETFDAVLHRHLMHRYLASVGASALVDRLCLKGALLLDVFHAGRHRHTGCVDFLALAPVERSEVVAVLGQALCEDRRDSVAFDVASLSVVAGRVFRGKQGLEGKVTARLANVSRQLLFRIDPVCGETPPHTDVPVHAVVDFKGMVGPHLQALTADAAVAERLESLHWRGARAARFEDIVDLYVLVKSTTIDAAKVANAIALAFRNQGLPTPSSVPGSLQPEFTLAADTARWWKRFLRREHLDGWSPKSDKAAPPGELSSLEVVASFLRVTINRWLFEIATRDQVAVKTEPVPATHLEGSHPGTQSLLDIILFSNVRQ